jgi:hypothetical protein
MVTVRKANDRGVTRIGWLDSRHTFSFGGYMDPKHHHYRSLRVINDDKINGGGGFDPHPHRDMEILTYVLSGELRHADSMGNGSVIRPGNWQKMSAGTGVVHAEFNNSDDVPLHLLQIWIVPDTKGLPPTYAEREVPAADKLGRWAVAASKDGRDGSIVVHQDVTLSVAAVRPGDELSYELAPGRGAWLHVATGAATVNGVRLTAGDAAAIEGEPRIEVTGDSEGEVLLFDLG